MFSNSSKYNKTKTLVRKKEKSVAIKIADENGKNVNDVSSVFQSVCAKQGHS